MSQFRVNVVARNPKDETQETPPIEVLVDTGSELTWLPADLLNQAGILPRRKRTFVTATRETVTRDIGYAILFSEGSKRPTRSCLQSRGICHCSVFARSRASACWWTTSRIVSLRRGFHGPHRWRPARSLRNRRFARRRRHGRSLSSA